MKNKMKLLKEFDNKLLMRKEVEYLENSSPITISRQEAKAKIAKALDVDENLVVITKIGSQFGSQDVNIYGFVYENEEVLKKLTPEHIAKRNAAPAASEE